MGKSSDIQTHTDKYSLIGALDPSTGEIKAVQLGDETVLGLATQLYVWNTSTLVWDKMVQPYFSLEGDVEVDTDALEALVADALKGYHFSGYIVDGTAVYIGYEDKAGVYYVQYIETSTGVVTYAVGTGGIVAPASYAGLSYGSFASKF